MNKGLEIYILIGNWALKLFLLNILWFLFSLLGLIAFGIFPATSALFAVLRKLTLESENTPVFKTFWKTYKAEFLRSNLLGYMLFAFGAILYIDLRVVQQLDYSLLNQLLTISLYVLLFIYVIILLNIFPIFVHYELKLLEYIKYAIILTLAKPIQTIYIIIGTTAIGFLYFKVPGLVPVFGISVISLFVLKIASRSFLLDPKE